MINQLLTLFFNQLTQNNLSLSFLSVIRKLVVIEERERELYAMKQSSAHTIK